MAAASNPTPEPQTNAARRRPLRRLALGVVLGLTVGVVGLGVAGTPAAAACSISTSVRLGSRGDAVRCVQQTLAAAGYATGPVDGSFGSVTHRAVVQFQSHNGLAVDGLVGPQTAAALGIWGSTTTPSTPAPTTPSAPTGCAISSTLRVGSSGSSVRCLQQALAAAGFSPGPVDGSFGGQTRNAVSSYQRSRGLTVDGVAGRQTGTALGIWGTASTPSTPSTPAPTNPPPSTANCTVSTTLRRGATGDQVRCLQRALAAAGFSPGPVDGSFGNQTVNAVTGYQRSKGLTVDGVVGSQTATALGIWTTGTSSSGSGSGSCTAPANVPAGARQLVVVDSNGSWATVDLLVHDGSRWVCVRENMQARVGRNGVRALANRRSGDGTTPAGTFGLGTMTAPDGQTFQFFGNGSNPGVQGTWRQVKQGDCWVATPGDPAYNTLTNRSSANCTGDDEYLPNYQNSYSQAALIDANMGPNRSGDDPGEPALAAAIFLHRHSYDSAGNTRATAGCVSLNSDNLAAVLKVLRPGEAYFVIR